MTQQQGYEMPPVITQKLARGARDNDDAIVVGSRAGIVEWANNAWTRVTGYALDESISKPVLTFLEKVDVDQSVVEFVASCFRQGKVCEVEVPLIAPGQRQLWIQLRVEPLFDASGEPSDFIATASDITERKRAQALDPLDEVDLSMLAARAARLHGGKLGPNTSFDLCLAENLPLVLADESMLMGLVGRLICRGAESIGDGWGTLTLWSGVLGEEEDAPLFAGDLRRGLPAGHYAFLEIHDTGGMPSGMIQAPVREPFLSAQFPRHAIRWMTAQRMLRDHGGEIRMESTPWGGTSTVILLPFCVIAEGATEALC